MDKNKILSISQPLLDRFEELENKMSDPRFHEDPSFTSIAKEHSALSSKVGKIREWKKIHEELEHVTDMIAVSEPELSELAKMEKDELVKKEEALKRELVEALIQRDPNDGKNIVLEIRAGTGGDEAALFASELGRMYTRYAELKGFRWEAVSLSLSDRNGYKEAMFFIESKDSNGSSKGAFSLFKYERGVHRVQRVPETEASGRIHTSTVTVAVMPEAEDVDVQVRSEDLRVDTYRASGHGGQHLQKTDSAVRITHLPTNVVVQCQDERSQLKNREKAMKLLRSKLLQLAQDNQERKIASDRKKQVGTGERSEKIRTYNFPQDRITDHRIGMSVHNIQEVLDGNLDALIQALQLAERELE